MIARSLLLLVLACAGPPLAAAEPAQQREGPGAYFSRQVLEASARAGDSESRWSLAWLHADQGSLERAWMWVDELPAKGDEQSYFKAWLAWQTGRADESLRVLGLGGCKGPACDALAVNAYWDKGSVVQAAAFALESYERDRTPRACHLAMLAALAAKDVAGFDRLDKSQPWRAASEFGPWRAAISGLAKARANM